MIFVTLNTTKIALKFILLFYQVVNPLAAVLKVMFYRESIFSLVTQEGSYFQLA